MSTRELIGAAIEAIRIHSSTRYSWFGRPSPRLILKLASALTQEQARSYLLNALTSRLYSDFYLRGEATSSGVDAEEPWRIGLTPLVAELSTANSGKGPWEDGWSVQSVGQGSAVVLRRGLLLRAELRHCAPGGSGIESGNTVRLHFPKELLGMSPGFYVALGDRPLEREDGTLTRVYWNLRADGAVSFVRTATERLNCAGVPFRLKVLRDRAHYTRCDAGVIYLFKNDYDAAADILREIYAEVSRHLKPGNPALTKPLAKGVGLAEDPGSGASFGMNRCRLLAEAAIRVHEKGRRQLSAQLEEVAEVFEEEGISLDRPFLNTGSEDYYEPFDTSGYSAPGCISQPEYDRYLYLQAAEEIGRSLLREAFWHGDQCTWLGREPALPGRDENRGTQYMALGPTLYSGTAGVALFLGELSAVRGSGEFRRTALGALRHAIARTETLPRKNDLALYTGLVGVAFAAVRTGLLLGEEELLEAVCRMLRTCVGTNEEPGEFDLLSGVAGGIIGFLAIRRMLPRAESSLLDAAARLGDKLLRTAEHSDAGYSWRSSGFRCQRNLTGFSHGAAGAGYALLELFRATGDTRYRAGARRAFDYERYWFIAEKGNWPDFRETVSYTLRRSTAACSTFWCHGAPGIALSRLCAYEILGEDEFKEEAATALATTRSMVESGLRSGSDNFLLCHGLAGNADVLLQGLPVLGTSASQLAFQVGKAAMEASERAEGAGWSFAGNGGSVSLLLGAAGLGYFYLRLHTPSIPSILMIRPESGPPG